MKQKWSQYPRYHVEKQNKKENRNDGNEEIPIICCPELKMNYS
jgi:hypothetical protein